MKKAGDVCSRGPSTSVTIHWIPGGFIALAHSFSEQEWGNCHGNFPACNVTDHHVTFFLLTDLPLSHALSPACNQMILRAELDGAALDQIVVADTRFLGVGSLVIPSTPEDPAGRY